MGVKAGLALRSFSEGGSGASGHGNRMNSGSHFRQERRIFFYCISHDQQVCACLGVEVYFFGVFDAAANQQGNFNKRRNQLDHFFGNGPPGAASRIHINQLHAEHFACHGSTKGNFIFIGRDGAGIADIRHGGGRSAVNHHIARRNDFQAAFLDHRSGNDMLSDQQFRIPPGDEGKIKQAIRVGGNLGWGSGEKDDRYMAACLDLLHHVVEMLGNDQAASHEKVVGPGKNCEFNDFSGLSGIHFIGINKHREGLSPVPFFNQ